MRRISGLAPITTFFILFAMLLTACGGTSSGGGGTTSSPSSGAKAKVALVTEIGVLNDRSLNKLAYGGSSQAQKNKGVPPKDIPTKYQKNNLQKRTQYFHREGQRN